MSENPPSAKDWWNTPAYQIAVFLIGLVSLVLGIYFYYASLRAPQISYTVSPVQVSFSPEDVSSEISVQYMGQKLEDPIRVAQVIIWNNGNELVRRDAIVSKPRIELPSGARLLEARIMAISRWDILFQLNLISRTTMDLSWGILEPQDGVRLQVVYSSKELVIPKVIGAVEKQREIIEVDRGKYVLRPALTLKDLFIALIPTLAGAIAGGFVAAFLARRSSLGKWSFAVGFGVLVVVSGIGLGGFALISNLNPARSIPPILDVSL